MKIDSSTVISYGRPSLHTIRSRKIIPMFLFVCCLLVCFSGTSLLTLLSVDLSMKGTTSLVGFTEKVCLPFGTMITFIPSVFSHMHFLPSLGEAELKSGLCLLNSDIEILHHRETLVYFTPHFAKMLALSYKCWCCPCSLLAPHAEQGDDLCRVQYHYLWLCMTWLFIYWLLQRMLLIPFWKGSQLIFVQPYSSICDSTLRFLSWWKTAFSKKISYIINQSWFISSNG